MTKKLEETKHYIAVYNGKEVVMDYISNFKDEFKYACMRIIDNGADGIVIAPDGKKWKVSQSSRKAKLIKESNNFNERKNMKKNLKENKIADKLMGLDSVVWHKLKFKSGNDIRDNWDSYVNAIKKGVQNMNIKKLDNSVYRDLENDNHHSLNKALVQLGLLTESKSKEIKTFKSLIKELM